MKKVKVVLLAALLVGAFCVSGCSNSGTSSNNASQTASTESSIVESSVAESSVEKSSFESSVSNNAGWEVLNYVDEFGDSTNSSYISYIAEGTFSNSATINSQLLVKVMVIPGDFIKFALFEYGSNRVVNSYSSNMEYEIAYKFESGETGCTCGGITSGNDSLMVVNGVDGYDGRISLKDFKTPQIIKIAITQMDRPTTKYRFSIDTTGFAEVYDNSILSKL